MRRELAAILGYFGPGEQVRGIVHRWTPPGAATAAHLTLLRPPAQGLPRAGINRFLTRRGR